MVDLLRAVDMEMRETALEVWSLGVCETLIGNKIQGLRLFLIVSS